MSGTSSLYTHGNGAPGNQSAEQYIKYVDEINCTWVGIYLDLSNHRKYSYCPDWIRAMGSRIIKCDTKDYLLAKDAKDGKKEGFCDIGEGSVDWPATRKALADINYYGWISSEVGGGNRARLADNLARMNKSFRARKVRLPENPFGFWWSTVDGPAARPSKSCPGITRFFRGRSGN